VYAYVNGMIDVYAVTPAWNESTASYDNQPTAAWSPIPRRRSIWSQHGSLV
jgi:hypothetical protein